MSDAFMLAGFVSAVVGVYLIAGLGWACLLGGVAVFVAGGLAGRRAS
jgi:hypothetical protein